MSNGATSFPHFEVRYRQMSCVFFENERAMKKRELEKDRVSAIPENYHGRVSGVSTLRIRG